MSDSSVYRVDVHHHIIPPQAATILTDLGIGQIGGVPIPHWNEEVVLAVLDRNGIEMAVVSTSDFPIPSSAQPQAQKLARLSNDFYADLIARYPKRFGAFAALPLPDVASSLRELSYALDTLHLDGVMLLSSYQGQYLGDALFEPVFEELNRRQAVVFIHPGTPIIDVRVQLKLPISLIEYVFDTTRAVTNLLISGSLERFPNIRFILAHAGGTIPYLTERLVGGAFMSAGQPLPPESPSPASLMQQLERMRTLLGRLYCDVALSTLPPTLSALERVVGQSHILFGSDYPYAPEMALQLTIQLLKNYPSFQVEARRQVELETALNLFPRLAELAN